METAEEARKESNLSNKTRIDYIINNAISKSEYNVSIPELSKSEVSKLTSLGYDVIYNNRICEYKIYW